MIDVLTYFKTEIETVGRHWQDLAAAIDSVQALRRPNGNMNHALWLTGHMACMEDYLIIEVTTGQSVRKKEWDYLFDHSSEKLPDEDYPQWSHVRNEYVRVHNEVLKFLATQHPSEMSRPSATERQWFPTVAHSISHQVTHGHYHLGQLVYLQKMLTPRTSGRLRQVTAI